MAADSGSLGIGEGSARQREREQILQLPQAGPWRRFFARATDMFLLSAPTAVAVIAFLDWLSPNSISWLLRPGFEYLFAFLLLPVVLLVEAVIFRVFGNTFGKMVFGVFVVSNFGNPLSLDGYILRQRGVYWAGLGLGIPIINLYTMARQYGRLKRGGQASYDAGLFNVKSRSLSGPRIVLASFIFTSVFVAQFAVQFFLTDVSTGRPSESLWSNEVTGTSVSIPRDWSWHEAEDLFGQPIYVFTHATDGKTVFVGSESIPSDMTLSEYSELWKDSVAPSIVLDRISEVQETAGVRFVQATGRGNDIGGRRVHALLFERQERIWRLVSISSDDEDPVSMPVRELFRRIINSTS